MTQEQINLLTQKIADGSISDEELQQYYNWLGSYDAMPFEVKTAGSEEELKDRIYWGIAQKADLRLAQPKTTRLWPRIAIAAAITVAVFGSALLYFKNQKDTIEQDLTAKNDVSPGRNGATLTLANGKVIALSDAKKGIIIDPASLTYDDGSSVTEGNQATTEIQQLTASTTRGQTYEITLPDGSHVFLNAESKISFPSKFTGNERRIILEGEAYFAVKHNEKQPFFVESKTSNGQTQVVEDIGTEFNINAYNDEARIRTTLVEGSASVRQFGAANTNPIILKPNQQATNTGNKINVKTIDVEQAIAWKHRQFSFDSEDIQSIMRTVARWYDIEVIYEGEITRDTFSGGVSRFDKLSSVLQSLEQAGKVHFKISGRKVYVTQ